MKEIKIFNDFKPNIEKYIRFYHSKQYIKLRSDSYGHSKVANETIMKLINYKNYGKFVSKRKKWDNCIDTVPVPYLTEIGVDLDALLATVDLDIEYYKKELSKKYYPNYFIIRLIPAVYSRKAIPKNTTEKEAIEIVKIFSKESKFRCCIKIENLKTIFIEPNGHVSEIFNVPSVKITKKRSFITFSESNNLIGRTFIK